MDDICEDIFMDWNGRGGTKEAQMQGKKTKDERAEKKGRRTV